MGHVVNSIGRRAAARVILALVAGLAAVVGGVGSHAWALGPKSGQPPELSEDDPRAPKQGPDELLEQVGIDQRLGAELPMGLEFTNSAGERVTLGGLVGERPVVLSLVYYECPMLCTMVLNGMLRVMNVIKFDAGREYDVITVSIDPRETPMLAADKKEIYLQRYRRDGAAKGWHFLVGDQDNVAKLAEAAGFRYAYDEATDQYAHGSGLVVLTPEGKISKYLYGIEYSPIDLRLALVEAASERIGSMTDAILLACFQYDPVEGTYSLTIMRFIRFVGVATVFGIILFIIINVARDRRRRGPEGAPEANAEARA